MTQTEARQQFSFDMARSQKRIQAWNNFIVTHRGGIQDSLCASFSDRLTEYKNLVTRIWEEKEATKYHDQLADLERKLEALQEEARLQLKPEQ